MTNACVEYQEIPMSRAVVPSTSYLLGAADQLHGVVVMVGAHE